ncbi:MULTISPECIES: bifunctional protein-serine/threonine kinase/phosphatase [unclassified Vibrio]|uniref:non-specific serine/threonine protein kinase n=1 Tax=Vibrio sp. HB236076 TaxID=3232307 RepID=A0AB39HI68_9VIBR|nr:bifunctional protein-serine/threonine kinase/phosphatase [Vibrio sp. HB161653]MDP5254646.1 bifunctional protein-serine/threonine kinase/phosphatase [Vibrio sp. HB161653]
MKTQAFHCQMEFGSLTQTGVKDQNQDAIIIKLPKTRSDWEFKGAVFCIADGISSSEHGQQASHVSTTQFVNDYYSTPNTWDITHSVRKVLSSLNQWLYAQGRQQLNHNGMITTFSSLIIQSNTAHLFHVGDCRVYLIRQNTMTQLTRDHSRKVFGQKTQLTRALGMDEHLELDYQSLVLRQGDKLLMTTDGLHQCFEPQQLLDSLNNSNTCQEQCEQLTQQVSQIGSDDNFSAIIIEIKSLAKNGLLEHQSEFHSKTIPPALSTGQYLDHFYIEEILHQGRRSHVYLAKDTHNDQLRVIKTLSLYDEDTFDAITQFANENWIGQQLDNRRLMSIYPSPVESEFMYQVCEYVPGCTLRQWMIDNPQAELHQVRILLNNLIQALRSLQRAHIVHRDLKPENIMVLNNLDIKIIDFGAAGIIETQPQSRGQFSIPLGDVQYAAPEYIDTCYANTQSDLFSVAVIGYELLTHQWPFGEKNQQNIAKSRHQKWQYQSLQLQRPDLPIWLDYVFEKATHPNPQHRYQVLGEFIQDLATPNPTLIKKHHRNPLIKKNPVLFWKSVAMIALAVSVFEALLLLNP